MHRARAPRALASASAIFTVFTAACSMLAGGDGTPEPGPEAPYIRAATLLEAGRYAEASAALREVASRCESGERGRHALLLLAALDLDPRNAEADPDSAALNAARFLSLQDLPVDQRPLGETLYLLALDRGGNPGLRPSPAAVPGGPASRFSSCDQPLTDRVVSLPVLPEGPRGESMLELQGQRDSAVARAGELTSQNAALQARVAELEAELERIRRILRARPDTTDAPPPRFH